MKRSEHGTATASPGGDVKSSVKSNGRSAVQANGEAMPADLSVILASLRAMRDGDFSARLPGHWTGLAGKVADTFNDIAATNQQMARELKRVGQVVGKEGRTRERMRFQQSKAAWGEMEVSVNTLVDDLVAADDRSDARDCGCGERKFDADGAVGCGWTSAGRRVFAVGEHREHDDSAAGRVHGGSDARGARSGHGRQAGRAGAGAGRGRNVEGPDGFRELDGQQPDWPGEKHCGSGDGCGERRFVAQDHGGRARRDSAAERSHQYDGGPAAVVRFGSDARGARSGYGRQAGRAGGGAGRGGHLEGS